MKRSQAIEEERQNYALRMSGCVVVALLLAISAFKFWPMSSDAVADIVYDARNQQLIQIEEIQPTQQKQSRPPPPAPITPVIVPDDVILDEIEIELTDELVTADTGDDNQQEEEGAEVPVSGGSTQPDAGPRAFRVVHPKYTDEAKRRSVKAEVVVEVMVNKSGKVESAQVVERFLLKGRDNEEREVVAQLGYGLEDAALAAAQQWQFRPARVNGQRVNSLTRFTLRFGI